jgi:hypothetical protein
MDRILSIVSIILAIAGLVPAFSQRDHRKKVIFIITGGMLLSLTVLQMWMYFNEYRRIEKAENEIGLMFAGNNPMSFEQIYGSMYYPSFDTANAAIDNLIDKGSIHSDKVDVVSEHGNKYVVRAYNSINFPVR